jgi:serine/threonine protein kinase
MATNQDKLIEIFSEALAKASLEERSSYLAQACGQDAALRRQVDALLQAHIEAGEFLRASVVPPESQPLGEGPGTTIGRYKLLQQIGEGGFGIVFMAEQQEPVRRMVALKIIKAGMDTREVIARFEAERQALALMDHPNIARVLDGGSTASGRPYFVMDLVKGIPITEFCDQNHLSTEARLRLFMKVCAGVQHAHQKGIIHRDLKPTNVLVTVQEGEPVPKVIDFGIAKAIGQKLTERTLFTRFEQLIGTPAYMSPEQAEWSGVDIDTRSDIYSLGALLYELLTGTTPFEKETLARAALDEVRRMLRETELPTPSTRLQGLGQRLDEVARQRHTEPSLLTRLVRGDLDWIVMRALDKDRARRYETANELAHDLERHLRGEPVVAGPPSNIYRAGKFIRRHRLAVAAFAGITLALAVGLALALLGFAQARRAGQRAEEDAAIANAINNFLQFDLLAQADPENTTNRNITVREVLDRASGKIKDRFTNQPIVEAEIELTLGTTYMGLSELDVAEPHIRRAVEICTRSFGQDARQTLDALNALAILYADQEKRDKAEPLLRQLVETYRRTLGPENATTLDCLRELGRNYLYWGRADQAEEIMRDLLEKRRRLLGPKHRETLNAMEDLAGVYCFSDRLSDAAAIYEEILSTARSGSDK